MESHSVIVVGGGLTGLSAARILEREGFDYCLYEAEERVGGLCRSEVVDGFTFDYTGHLLHFTDPSVEQFVRDVLQQDLVQHERRAWIQTEGAYTRYPFQRNLFGLPQGIVKECVLEYVEATLGKPPGMDADFESWVAGNFGKGIARHFMLPYNRKLWLTEPGKLTCHWMGRFVPDTNPVGIIKGAFSSDTAPVGYNASFFYPSSGGIEILPNSLAAGLSRVNCGRRVERIEIADRTVHFRDGSSCQYESLVSTMPLPELISCINPIPDKVKELASRLKHVSVLDVNIGLDLDNLSEKHWVYVPDREIPFYRIGFPHNFSSSLVPKGKASVYAEISHRGSKRLREGEVVRDVVSGMRKMGFSLTESDILAVNMIDIKYAYVVYDFDREKSLDGIKLFLAKNGITSVGRFGSWAYLSMEDSIREGISAALGLAH